jgi:hypothetical protein
VIRLLITAGRGSAECRIAIANTLAAMARDAAEAELDLDVAAGPDRDGHGPASAIAVVSGPPPRSFAQNWPGSIQWIAESPLRPRHRRKNWFVGVMTLPETSVPPARSIRGRCVWRRSGRAAPADGTRTRPNPLCARCTSRAPRRRRPGRPVPAPQQGGSRGTACDAAADVAGGRGDGRPAGGLRRPRPAGTRQSGPPLQGRGVRACVRGNFQDRGRPARVTVLKHL